MTGGTDYKHRGLVPRCIAHLFNEIHQKTENAYTVRISFLEIYNETIYDLLSNLKDSSGASAVSPGEELTVMEDPKGLEIEEKFSSTTFQIHAQPNPFPIANNDNIT